MTDSRTIDWNPFEPAALADPYGTFADACELKPVPHRPDRAGGRVTAVGDNLSKPYPFLIGLTAPHEHLEAFVDKHEVHRIERHERY